MADETKPNGRVESPNTTAETSFTGRWLRRLMSAAFCLIALIAAAPTIISHTSLGDLFLEQVQARLPAGTSVDSIAVSWLHPLRAVNVTFADERGTAIKAREVETGQSLLWVLINRTAPNSLVIRGVDLVIDLDSEEPVALPHWKQSNQPVTQTDTSLKLPRIRIEDLSVTASGGPLNSPVRLNLNTVDVAPETDGQLKFAAAGSLLLKETPAPVQITGELNQSDWTGRIGLAATAVPTSDVLEAIAIAPAVDGPLDLQAVFTSNKQDFWEGKLAVTSASLTLPDAAPAPAIRIESPTVRAAVNVDVQSQRLAFNPVILESDVASGQLTGTVQSGIINADGNLAISGRLLQHFGVPNEISTQQIALSDISLRPIDGVTTVTGNAAWPEATIYGLTSRRGFAEFALTPDGVDFTLTDVDLADGRAMGQYRVDWSSDVPVLQVSGGQVLQGITLTNEVCRDWIRYVSPAMANATEVRGRFGLELTPCRIPLAAGVPIPPMRGRLLIDGATMRPGPLGQELFDSIGEIGSFAGADRLSLRMNDLGQSELMEIPQQAVEFMVQGNTVAHRGFTLESGKVTVTTEGAVTFDEQLNLLTRLQIDRSAFSDRPILANALAAPIEIPVAGTFDAPRIDRSSLKNFAAGAAGGALNGLLEGLLNRDRRKK